MRFQLTKRQAERLRNIRDKKHKAELLYDYEYRFFKRKKLTKPRRKSRH